MKIAKVLITTLFLIVSYSATAATDYTVRSDLCEDELKKCKQDCDENWNQDLYKGACYLGCFAGYVACELFIE